MGSLVAGAVLVVAAIALVAAVWPAGGDGGASSEAPGDDGTLSAPEATVVPRDRDDPSSRAYDAQVLESCGLAVLEADGSFADAAAARASDHDPRWSTAGSQQEFVAAVAACATAVGQAQDADGCGGVAPVALLVADADLFRDRCYPLVVSVAQYDSRTGLCRLRAAFDAVPRRSRSQYEGTLALVTFPEPCPELEGVEVDDVLLVHAVVDGVEEYETVFGSTRTAVGLTVVGDATQLSR